MKKDIKKKSKDGLTNKHYKNNSNNSAYDFMYCMVGVIIGSTLLITIIFALIGIFSIGSIIGALMGGCISQLMFFFVCAITDGYKEAFLATKYSWKQWMSNISKYVLFVVRFVVAFVFYHTMCLIDKE